MKKAFSFKRTMLRTKKEAYLKMWVLIEIRIGSFRQPLQTFGKEFDFPDTC